MTRSRFKREMPEAERGAIALDSIYAYLRNNHPEHAAQIALRMTYRLALIWKCERDHRLATNPNDPRLTFHINDQYVHRLHSVASALPPPSQPEVLAERHAMSLLVEFDPDRAWLTSHKLYNELGWQSGHTLDLRYGPVGWTQQGSAPLSSGDRAQE
jgi:hypothetical protein